MLKFKWNLLALKKLFQFRYLIFFGSIFRKFHFRANKVERKLFEPLSKTKRKNGKSLKLWEMAVSYISLALRDDGKPSKIYIDKNAKLLQIDFRSIDLLLNFITYNRKYWFWWLWLPLKVPHYFYDTYYRAFLRFAEKDKIAMVVTAGS